MAQHAIEFSIQWTVETCCNCGAAFAVPTSLWEKYRSKIDAQRGEGG